jgi:hypothetical protein
VSGQEPDMHFLESWFLLSFSFFFSFSVFTAIILSKKKGVALYAYVCMTMFIP